MPRTRPVDRTAPPSISPASVFADRHAKGFPHSYYAELTVGLLAGGVPSDPNVAEKWLATKLTDNQSDLIRQAVAEVMLDREVDVDAATQIVNDRKHLNGFRRDRTTGELYVRDYQVAAMLKESANVAAATGKIPRSWGLYRRGLLSFFVEHVAVRPFNVGLGVKEPTGIEQRFPHTFRGTGISYTEYVEDAHLAFTVVSDHEFTADQWAEIWMLGETTVGLGAMRGQGFGRFDVTRWDHT